MRKITIFTVGATCELPKLEESVNKFIKDKQVSNIQYQTSSDADGWVKHSVMVVYEE